MTPARLRELAGVMSAAEHVGFMNDAQSVSIVRETAGETRDVLTWAAGEIERLTTESEWRRETLVKLALRVADEEAEVKRLRVLAREGWTMAREQANYSEDEERASIALTEIEAAS